MNDPIASLVDFLASQLAPLAGVKDSQTSDGSGPRLHDALGCFGPDGAYSRTSLDFFRSTEALPSGKFSETWPVSGTMRAGSVSPLPMWAPPTSGNGSGSWPTSRTVTGGAESAEHIQAAVDSWATPSTRDWKDTPGMAVEAVNPDGSMRRRDDQLGRQAGQFDPGPTPSLFGEPMAPSDSSPVTPKGRAATGSRAAYNPRFGLWLMGMPVDWLDAAVFRGQRPKRTTPERAAAASAPSEPPATSPTGTPASPPTPRTSHPKRKAG